MTPELLSLLEVLAELEVRNYLHPDAAPDNDPGDHGPNHPASDADREAA